MLTDKEYNEFKQLFKEAVMESLKEEELIEGLNIKDCINFIKNLVTKAKELGIRVDSDLEQELNTTTESMELTEGFMSWLKSKKQKILNLLLSVMLATSFPSVTKAMTFKNFDESNRNISIAEFEVEGMKDIEALHEKFDATYFQYFSDLKTGERYTNEPDAIMFGNFIEDDNSFIGYKIIVTDTRGDNDINVELFNKQLESVAEFSIPREHLGEKTLKDFLRKNNYHLEEMPNKFDYVQAKSEKQFADLQKKSEEDFKRLHKKSNKEFENLEKKGDYIIDNDYIVNRNYQKW